MLKKPTNLSLLSLGAGKSSGFRNQRDAGETSSLAHMTQRQMTRCAAALSPRQQVGRRLSHVPMLRFTSEMSGLTVLRASVR